MAHLPEAVQGGILEGLTLSGRGKVRDIYQLGKEGVMLPNTSDRLSMFDFVMPFYVPFKGQVLNAINVFMATQVFKGMVEQDIVAYGAGIDEYLPESLRGNPELQKTATVVRQLPACDFEGIVRNYLLGSSVKPYHENQMVSGHRLPAGLREGDELPCPIFTPSTKAETGHDQPISFLDVEKKYGGWPERLALQIMSVGRKYLRSRGLEVPDTKFEFAFLNNVLCLIDERLTPDSSRVWDMKQLAAARAKGKMPSPLDKQYAREWGKQHGLDAKDMDPEDPEALAYVAGLERPNQMVAMTSRIYRYLAWRIFGTKLEEFQRGHMGINTAPRPVNVQVILGSRSDLPQARAGLRRLESSPKVNALEVNIISCHRNPADLMNFTRSAQMQATDVIIAGAGKAAALPGMTKAFLNMNGFGHIPVIGVAFMGDTSDADDAAMLSIEELPGNPVEMDRDGQAYFGADGFVDAAESAIYDEFLPQTPVSKPAEFDIAF